MAASLVSAYGCSNVGSVRESNQDSLRIQEPDDERNLLEHGSLYGIADGMGGYEHGGVASALALEAFFTTFYSGRPSKSPQTMRQAVDNANLAVYQAAQRYNARMGTTLSVINLIGHQLHLAHIGDSRVYLVRGRKATCLTNDHTAVGELVRMKLLAPDKVRTHERRSILEKCLGMQLFVQPDISTHLLNENDYLILCTDGVWAYVQDDEFAQVVHEVAAPEQIAQALIDLALQRDSDDNVSAVAIHVRQLMPMPVVAAAERSWGLTHLLRSRLGGKA
ncbi:MAG TPA: protein phosphatase 2C domain-containing protein [Phototrophicaceae bacterium]|nr:protein phosphatase 2C domain-containing protein [Phototrophicaceae bacterium]